MLGLRYPIPVLPGCRALGVDCTGHGLISFQIKKWVADATLLPARMRVVRSRGGRSPRLRAPTQRGSLGIPVAAPKTIQGYRLIILNVFKGLL